MAGLTPKEIMVVVTRWIGVNGGYLGDFSYRKHAEFYPLYCNLDYDPGAVEGTTRQRFIHILTNAPPHHQAKIIRATLDYCPHGQDGAPDSRTPALEVELRTIADRVECAAAVAQPELSVTSEFVERAIQDAEALIRETQVGSAVDRLHAALHGYLQRLCHEAGLQYVKDDPLTRLLKILREGHPALRASGPQAREITTCLRALASVVDMLQPVRNHASMAHPTEDLLGPEEATLVVNAVRSVFQYLDSKVARHSRGSAAAPAANETMKTYLPF